MDCAKHWRLPLSSSVAASSFVGLHAPEARFFSVFNLLTLTSRPAAPDGQGVPDVSTADDDGDDLFSFRPNYAKKASPSATLLAAGTARTEHPAADGTAQVLHKRRVYTRDFVMALKAACVRACVRAFSVCNVY